MNINAGNINTITQFQEANIRLGIKPDDSVIAGKLNGEESHSPEIGVRINFNTKNNSNSEELTMEEMTDLLNSKPENMSNILYRIKPSRELNTQMKTLVENWREEKGWLIDKDDSGIIGDYEIPESPIFSDDDKLFLHHSFVTKSNIFKESFNYEASRYSKYLTENKEPINDKND